MPIKILAAAAVFLGIAPAVASADAGRVAVSGQIAYSDLDLTSAAGREAFDRRIRTTVRRVCGPVATRDLKDMMEIHRCRREAMASSTRGRDLAIANSTRRGGLAMVSRTMMSQPGN